MRIGAVSVSEYEPLDIRSRNLLRSTKFSTFRAALADDLAAGQLDVALSHRSVFSARDYQIVLNACIACRGSKCGSVKFF